MFILSAGVLFVGWFTFITVVSTEEQPWAKGEADAVQVQVPEEDDNMKPLNPGVENEDRSRNGEV